jgi:hypothetical protein
MLVANHVDTTMFVLNVIRAGRPDSPFECFVQSAGETSVVLQCIVGYDGGDPVIYVVYALPTTSAAVITCQKNVNRGQLLKLCLFVIYLFV